MPSASIHTEIIIHASPQKVFEYVSDLTRHGEWTADTVQVIALSAGQITVGSRYRSTAQSRGITFNAEIEITEYNPPKSFTFTGSDQSGKFSHRFTFEQHADGTLLKRQTQLGANLIQTPIFLIALYPLRVLAAKKALRLLKQKIETMN